MQNHLYLLLSFVIAASLAAQDKTPEIDKIFSWARPDAPRCAVAVSLSGKVVVNRAYGSADLERDVAIAPNTVFDAGSVTKQFVAAATSSSMTAAALSDDVRKYIPELRDYGHRITVDYLLTHTSGVRDWTGLQMLAATKTGALTMTLRQRGLNFAAGEEWEYSNGGYVLLREIIARTSGMPVGEFMRRRLFELFGMKSTAALTSGRLRASVTEKLQEPARLNNGRIEGVDLSSRSGLFFNERTGAPLQLAAADGRLRVAGGPALLPIASKRFRRSGVGLFFMSQDELELRFVRDRNGRVVALDYANPLLHNVRFTRAGR